MKNKGNKKVTILSLILALILIFSIFFLWNKSMGNASKQVRKSIDFIDNLVDIGAITVDGKPNAKEMQEMKNSSSINSTVLYTITWQNCGIDLDEDYNVVGFLNQGKQSNSGQDISEAAAVEYAEKYLKEIMDDRHKFDQVIKNDMDDSSFYTISFYKYHGRYLNYNNQILVKINKKSGDLIGYSAYSDSKVTYNKEININEKNAIGIGNDYLALNKIDEFENTSIEKGYYNNGDNSSQLCYILTYKDESKEYKVMISTYDGSVINSSIS